MRKIAMLVANDTFPEDTSIPPLRFTQNDASELKEILDDPETCGFKSKIYLNETSQKVLADLEEISGDLEPDDTLLFYYAGHGKLRRDGQLCLATMDTTMANLGARSIRARDVLTYLHESHARRRVLILDCCQSGAIGREFRGDDLHSALAGLADSFGSYILTASTAIQFAAEREKDGHGVFTKALIDCLRDGGKESITVNDWYEYAYRRLKVVANQTPLKWGLQEEGLSFEIGNFRAKHERERQRKREQLEREYQLEQERLERERQLERERFERERQREREQLISTARARLGAYVALGELSEEQVEEAIALLKRDEARLFPRDRKYRDDLIRFSKGELSFLQVFSAGQILRPEPAPKLPKDEAAPPVTPPEPSAVDQPVMPPEPAVIDQPAGPPETAVADEPIILSEPSVDQFLALHELTVVDQAVAPPNPADAERPITLPEPEEPQGLIGNAASGGKVKGKLQVQAPRFSPAAIALFVSIALVVTLLGTFFYVQSPHQSELNPQSAEPSRSNVSSPEPAAPAQRAPAVPVQPATVPVQPAPATPVQPATAAPALQESQGPFKVDLVPTQNDWTKVCGHDQAANKDTCYTTRDFNAQAGEKPVLAMAVYDIKGDDTHIIRLLVPVGLMVRPGFRFAIDNGQTHEGSFEICFPNGCFAEAKVNSAIIDQLKRGSKLSATVKNQKNNEVTFVIPLAGFRKAFDGPSIDPKVLEEQNKNYKN